MKSFCFTCCIALALNANQALGSEQGMPQLNPEFWLAQVFWLTLIFSSLYVIIWKIFLPKITDSIENRKLRVTHDLNEAQKLKENAERKLREYNKIIEDSKKEAKKIIEDNRKKLEKDIKNKRQKFNEEIEKELLSAEKEIESLKKTSISNINIIAVEIASEIIKHIVGTKDDMSNISAIVKDISKRKIEKYL